MIKGGLYDRGFFVNYDEGDEALYRTPVFYVPGIADEYHTITEDETLLSIAVKRYDTDSLWYLIADANESIDDIFILPEGETIVIPNLDVIASIYA